MTAHFLLFFGVVLARPDFSTLYHGCYLSHEGCQQCQVERVYRGGKLQECLGMKAMVLQEPTKLEEFPGDCKSFCRPCDTVTPSNCIVLSK